MARSIEDIIKDYKEITGNTTEYLETATKLQERLNALSEEQVKSYDKILLGIKERLKELEAENDVNEMIFGNTVENYKIRQKELDNNKDILLQKQKLLRLEFETGNLTREELKAKLQLLKTEFDINNAKEKGLQTADNFASKMGLMKADNTMFGILFKDPKVLANGMAEFGQRMKENLAPVNLFASGMQALVSNSIELIKELDGAAVSFNKATGFSGQFNDEIYSGVTALQGYGEASKNYGTSFNNLIQNYKDFSKLDKDLRQGLAESNALLTAQGFTSEAQAKNLQFLTKSFNLTAIQANNFNVSLDNLAEKMDIPITQLSTDFTNASKVLAAVGGTASDLSRNFANLANISKTTGLSVDRILAITGKFDTFDEAAKSVGSLNAMLGGPYLSTLEMVEETDPSKRFKLLADSVMDAAGSFDELSYYQKKAIASAMGLADVTELAAVMSGRVDLIEDPFANLTSDEIIKKKEEMKEFMSIADQFAQIGRQIVIGLGPTIPLIKEFANSIQFLVGNPIGKFVLLIFAFTYAATSAIKAAAALKTAFKILGIEAQIAGTRIGSMVMGGAIGVGIGLGLNWLLESYPTVRFGLGVIALGIAGIAFWAGSAAVAIGFATGGLTLLLGLMGTAAAASTGMADSFSDSAEAMTDFNGSMYQNNSPSLMFDTLPSIRSQMEDLGTISDTIPVSLNKTSKSIVDVKHSAAGLNEEIPKASKELTQLSTSAQRSLVSGAISGSPTAVPPINTKIELTLDGKKVAETVHSYKVPEESVAGKSVRSMSIPSGEMI